MRCARCFHVYISHLRVLNQVISVPTTNFSSVQRLTKSSSTEWWSCEIMRLRSSERLHHIYRVEKPTNKSKRTPCARQLFNLLACQLLLLKLTRITKDVVQSNFARLKIFFHPWHELLRVCIFYQLSFSFKCRTQSQTLQLRKSVYARFYELKQWIQSPERLSLTSTSTCNSISFLCVR